ncbi:MAG: STAS domain-containing protein [Candidatus Eremiobacteraeota bacterium]|nr:STAS domain-containing protein [Candidatus Eremiobacteraeota bacterium]
MESPMLENEPTIVTLHGLYDDGRREELALALIPILSGQSTTINFSNVEHIDVAALASLLPALQSRADEGKPFVYATGMNDDVRSSLQRAGLTAYFKEG